MDGFGRVWTGEKGSGIWVAALVDPKAADIQLFGTALTGWDPWACVMSDDEGRAADPAQ